jgi:RHS repeat-associated protein
VTFAWDANGNQVSRTVGGVTTLYRFDVRDRMVETLQGGSILGRFQYDFEGRRSKKIGEEGVRQYVYDQTSSFLEYDDAGAQVAKYDYGSDRPISLLRRDEPRRFFGLDGLRSVTNLTDAAGAVAARYHLDAWGNFRFPAELSVSKNRFAFTGYEWDPEIGLFNAKARYFDPQLGRFLTQDSFLGQIDEPPSLHRYVYGYANPLRYVDPTGHAAGDLWDPRSYDWRVFGQEFGTRLGETGANIATLGGYGGIKRGFEEGSITGTDFGSAGRAYAEGVFNTITLGGGERAIGAYAEGKGAGGVAVEGLKSAGETALPINEFKALADPTKSGWEKAEAIATASTKVASLAAGGLAARNALAQRATTHAAVATESAAGADAALAPAEGSLPPLRPLPRVAGGLQAATESPVTTGPRGIAHPGRLAAESSEITQESVVRALRQSDTVEGAATAKLIKRGRVNLDLVDDLGEGVGGEAPYGSSEIRISRSASPTPQKAAGYAAHETRHVLQRLTPNAYGQLHEFDPYRWQRRVDPSFFLQSDAEVMEALRAHPAYRGVPWRGEDIWWPNR